MVAAPRREDIDLPIEETLIVELYSKLRNRTAAFPCPAADGVAGAA